MPSNAPRELLTLWAIHREAPWPTLSGPHAGPLMTLDTVIGGCLTYYVESTDGLDAPRIEMLAGCLDELAGLTGDLPDDVKSYFGRLHRLGAMLLAIHQ